MTGLTTEPNIDDPDAVYAALLARHEGKTEAESAAYNARLILILLNQIGDARVIAAALDAAEIRAAD